MGRAIERKDFEAIYAPIAKNAVKHFNKHKEHMPTFIMVKLGNEPGEIHGVGALHPQTAADFFSSYEAKQNVPHFLRLALMPGSPLRGDLTDKGLPAPDVIVQICEAWVRMDSPKEGESEEAFTKRAEKILPSQAPDRIEVILIILHTRNYSTMGICKILDTPTRHAELGELQPEDGRMEGMMSMTVDE